MMKIPINCEKCGALIATFDTQQDAACNLAERPCGAKACDSCCDTCESENSDGANYPCCPYKEDI